MAVPHEEPDLVNYRAWTAADLDWYQSLSDDAQLQLAERMSNGLRLALGTMLFDRECDKQLERIREVHPSASPDELQALVRKWVEDTFPDESDLALLS